jgi:cytidine deaminase
MAKTTARDDSYKKLEIPDEVRKAFALAKKVRGKAHAPYSSFKVGASLIAHDGQLFTGCNVENASYGGAVCAERVAILKAVSEGYHRFRDIVVVTDAPEPAFPCAFCLQIMAEFFEPETRIWVADLKAVRSVHAFKFLLPKPFGPRQLRQAKK